LSALILGGCSLIPQKSGLEVISYPPAKVYVDNKEMGMTPYKNTNLKPGTIEVKLVTNDSQWSKNVELQNNVNTVVDWEFGSENKFSGGYVLYLEKTGDTKKAGLMVNAQPDKSAISIDNEIKGYSPERFDDISEGDRQLTLSSPGKKNMNVYLKATNGYQLIIDASLAEEEVATDSSSLAQPTPSINDKKMLTIKETETGWLRVRDTSDNSGKEVAKVKPNEQYAMLNQTQDWFLIDLGNGTSGWISSKYASLPE
jgi:hypothetical protein